MNIAVILSAGSGKRFESDIPKQFLKLKGVQIINYSLKKFQESPLIDAIVVVSGKESLDRTKEISKTFSKVISVVSGGERRQDSVFNALSLINKQGGCDKVIIHDSARPLFTAALLGALINGSKGEKALIPVIPLEDTVKKVKGSLVDKTLDRKDLVRVQTPQVFDFRALFDAYLKFPKDSLATDDAFIMEYFGNEVRLISGEKSNIKITYPDDIKLAEYMLE